MTEQQPLVSVIVPIYKVEQYLDTCVQSIVDQTYSNLEIFLVDDGSPDQCGAMCDAWAERDARITALHKSNGGLSDARNYGIDRAHGTYIYCVDSDDWIMPNLIETTVAIALREHCEMVQFEYNLASDDGSSIRLADAAARFPAAGRYSSAQALQMLWDDKVQNYAWSYLVHRRIYDAGIRYPKGYLMEDMGTAYRLYDEAQGIYYLPEPLYNYRVRGDSIFEHKTPAVSQDTVHFITLIDQFAAKKYPQLLQHELNWSIQYLGAAIIWAYEARDVYDPREYKAFMRSTRKLITQRIRKLGVKHMSKTNLMKCAAIFLHVLPLLEWVSQRRSGRSAN